MTSSAAPSSSARTLDFSSVQWSDLEIHSRDDIALTRDRIKAWLAAPQTPEVHAALQLLATLAALRPDLREGADCAFIPASGLDQLSLPELEQLISAVNTPAPQLLRARAVDVAWSTNRACSHTDVERAVADYVNLAKSVFDPSHWLEGYQFFSRAVALGASIGRGSEAHRSALNAAFDLVSSLSDDPKYFSCRIGALLLDHRHPQLALLGDAIYGLSQAILASGDAPRARDYLDLFVRIRLREGNQAAARNGRVEVATLLEKDAAAAASKENYLNAAALQMQAVEAWRQVGGAKTEASRAQSELQRLQRLLVEHMPEVTPKPVDVSEMAVAARKHVSGKTWFEALLAFSTMRAPNASLDAQRESARRTVGEFLHYSLFPMRTLSFLGRSVHTRPSAMTDSDATIDSALHHEISLMQQFFAMSYIWYALETIQLEHGLTGSSLFGLVARSPFVPPDRVVSFARGLGFGFQGEFQLAAHLLLPQFENAVRAALEARGAVVSTLPASQEQNELDLGGLLKLPEAKSFFGEDQLFELRSLLVEKAGTNLRNSIAHGLLPDDFELAHMVYFWWKVLQYVVLPLAISPNVSGEENSKDAG